MSSFNKVVLMGNLTKKPELKHTPSGMACADAGLAINEAFKAKDGSLVERAVFVDLVLWGKQAELISQYMDKGSPVLIEGALQLDQWTDTKTNLPRSKIRVRVERVQFLNRAQPAGLAAPTDAEAPAYVDSDNITF